MATNLIRLADGTLVEVEARENEPRQISSDQARKMERTLADVHKILVNACTPLIAAWAELNQDVRVEQAEVEVNLGFEGEAGIPYLVKGSGSANLTIKLTLKPK